MSRLTRVRVVGVSVPWAMVNGAIIGFVPGLFIGCLIGAGVCWGAGTVLDWQRELAFTLGVTQQLLPFGDQAPVLQQVSQSWQVVIPICGGIFGVFWALIGTLAAGVVAAVMNRFGIAIPVRVEQESADPSPELPRSSAAEERRLRKDR
ncbi:MAG TPA: hypothetical protein VIA06_17405 [Candidatus Dormibacteraeota bacterium]|nr:hypothetical protein [Candidatus Dormibacteraeota bacterium]